jgi:hypothetical protein
MPLRVEDFPMKTSIYFLTISLALTALSGFAARAQDITGVWAGTVSAGAHKIRMVLHICKNEGGTLQAVVDSPDEGAYGLPVTSMALEGSKLTFKIPSAHGSYQGTVAADGKTISGTWKKWWISLPLNFARTSESPPSEPKPPKRAASAPG